ncbi:polysaccharide deacetylase family protein [Reinekea marinisedimentorum]|uniref:Polysaccharide deacetylase n=1 Tax=Reinekea marinisedimentorum TaxID=230495 RepID=A0A4R3I7E8_9GAMM|nr:polysaccharide deacetylase family protein [Reinekea marinisedimentorum]TCS41700.1 polysaccharide deacetylase [Reinekea marinisedimentorum]
MISSQKIACFRLDIDTLRCIEEGVPYLIETAARYDAILTFFLNAGQSMRYRDLLPLGKSSVMLGAPKVSAQKKLGHYYLLRTLLGNPALASAYPEQIRSIIDCNHELGLHGGKNHGAWMRNVDKWSAHKLEDEINWGVQRIQSLTQTTPKLFCSPGWVGCEKLPETLSQFGFTVLADKHGRYCTLEQDAGLIRFPTHLVGEPDGVGYFEHLYAQSLSDEEIMNKFIEDLKSTGDFVVFYDHPCFIGGLKRSLAPQLFSVLSDLGYRVLSFSQALDQLKVSSA